ncbi:MAG: transposase [Nitrospira sp.]|nr:transposase [Nitrospira sp.]
MLYFIQSGKPVQNAFIESINGKFRDECLNEHCFLTPREAQLVIEVWWREYNEELPHSAIGNLTHGIHQPPSQSVPDSAGLNFISRWCNKRGEVNSGLEFSHQNNGLI